jgi:ligand-binding SRPBCC domain-containing protein
MKIFTYRREIELRVPRSEVFSFFSDPGNLQLLTPDWLDFRILTPSVVMAQGATIDYRLRVHRVPLRWRSEIVLWKPPEVFVDEQRHGPYRHWSHTHLFEQVSTGTRVTDKVAYAVLGGRLVNRLFVERDLKKIFDFRQRRLIERFGS